jgi:signal transduction histidine kinase
MQKKHTDNDINYDTEKQAAGMRGRNVVSKLVNTYFNQDLDLRVQLFNLLAFTGITAGIVVAVVSAAINAGALTIIVNLMASVLGFSLLRIAGKWKCYRLCGWIIIIAVFLAAFPILFFTGGGYRSGMPAFFVLAMVFTAAMTEKGDRIFALAVECIVYTACCLAAFFYPETVSTLQFGPAYVIDVIAGIVASGLLLSAVTVLHVRLYNIKQDQASQLYRELIVRNTALTRYNRMKSDFLSMVAHEVGTPMTTIMASSRDTLDLLEELPLDIDEIAENQRRIERKVMLIDGIITDLMDAVAIENGRLSLNSQPVALSELLEISCNAHFRHQDINNNSIVYDFQPGLSLISADAVRVEQVILNLLSNAVQHTYNGTILIKLARRGSAQVVSVSDDGEGMGEETMKNAFVRRISSKEDYWRHGIGLHVCRLIVEAHGGEIWIDSEMGRGTTVSFSLKEGPID